MDELGGQNSYHGIFILLPKYYRILVGSHEKKKKKKMAVSETFT